MKKIVFIILALTVLSQNIFALTNNEKVKLKSIKYSLSRSIALTGYYKKDISKFINLSEENNLLLVALGAANKKNVLFLLENGADVTLFHNRILFKLIKNYPELFFTLDVTKLDLKKGDLLYASYYAMSKKKNNNILSKDYNARKIFNYLIKKGFKIKVDSNKHTSSQQILIKALSRNDVEVLKLAIKQKVDLNKIKYDQNTYIDLIARFSKIDFLKIMLNNNYKPGEKTLGYAISSNHNLKNAIRDNKVFKMHLSHSKYAQKYARNKHLKDQKDRINRLKANEEVIALLKKNGAPDSSSIFFILYILFILLISIGLFVKMSKKDFNKIWLGLTFLLWLLTFVFSLFFIKSLGFVIMIGSLVMFFIANSAIEKSTTGGWDNFKFQPLSLILIIPLIIGYILYENSAAMSKVFFHTKNPYRISSFLYIYIVTIVLAIGVTIKTFFFTDKIEE